jgi:GH35 family endo-1,4-beta-xylanase
MVTCIVVFCGFTPKASAQTSITGGNLAYKSLGTQSTTLSATGYLGTYLTIPAGGSTINFTVNANATAAGSPGHMEVMVGNSNFAFNVSSTSSTNYNTQNVTLPAGTYFVGVDRDYDNGVNQSFAVNNLSVSTVSGSSAKFANDAGFTTAAATDATNAANTYIDNYREGTLNLKINGVAPGTPVEIKEVNSAFKWGTNVPDPVGTYLTQGSQYSNLLLQNFNSITPENAGKWAESETTSQLNNLDTLTNYAARNNIRVRMHNVVWGSQQPTDVNTDFTNAQSSNPTTAAAGKSAITTAIANRVAGYVSGTNSINGAIRATQYGELDVYNESYNTGANAGTSTGDNYWKVMGGGTAAGGAAWTGGLYNQVQSAVTAAGANTKLFTNDYNILNNNSDQYGQFYSQNVESIRNGNGANTGSVTGIGLEWYNTPGVGTNGSEVDPARSYATFENLAAQGLPLEVTEFGENGSPSSTTATSLTTAMTLAFGTPAMTGFTLWGFYNDGANMYAQSAGSVLYDNSYNITANGTAYGALQRYWNTDVNTVVNSDGSVTLPSTLNADGTSTATNTAFYGNYEAIINGQDYAFTFNPSTNSYVVSVPEPCMLIAPLGLFLLIRRPSRKLRGLSALMGVLCVAMVGLRSEAAILTWDAGTAGGNGSHPTSPQDGSGTWSTAALNWSSGSSDAGWANSTSNSAVIGSGNNTVSGVQTITMGGAVTLGNITFGTVSGGSYDIVGTSGNTLGMTGSTPTVTVNSSVSAEIDAAIAVTGSQPDLTVNGAGTLNMNPTVEGSNFHGLILGGTSNVVLLSSAAVPIVIPNNTTAANFSGGTLTFAATPTTDISGRITTTGSSAVNLVVTNGATVTFGNPLGGSGGLNVNGSGAGSTLELTESGGSQVAFSGSGGVNINGATLYLTGSHNNELGSNAVTVGVNGILGSDSTKLVTTGTTTVNGAITGGSGDVSGNSYGNMHLSATVFDATGDYVWKLNVHPSAAYHNGSVVNSVMTSGALNANSLTNFDSLFFSSLTDSASGFGIKLVTAGTSNLANGTYKFAIANTASGTFNLANFNYNGFTLSSVADSTLAAASNGGVNSQLNGGTGQDLILTYTVGSLPLFSLTTTAPGSGFGSTITNGSGNLQGTFSGSGASQNKLTVSGGSGSYSVQQATGITDGSGSVAGPGQANIEANGFSPAVDQEIFALDVEVGGSQASLSQLNTLISEAVADGLPSGMTLSTTSPSPDPFASNYNLYVDVNPGLASDVFLGWNLLSSNDANLAGGYTISAVGVVPEPSSLAGLGLATCALMARRTVRRARKLSAVS